MISCLASLQKRHSHTQAQGALLSHRKIARYIYMLQARDAKDVCSMDTRLSTGWNISMIIEDPYEHKREGRFKYRPHQEHQADPLCRNLGVFSLAWGFRCAASLTSGCPEPVTVCFAHWAPSHFLLLHLHLHPFRFISSTCALDLGHPIHGSRSRAAPLRSPGSPHTAHCTVTISYQSIASGSRPIHVPFRTCLL